MNTKGHESLTADYTDHTDEKQGAWSGEQEADQRQMKVANANQVMAVTVTVESA